MPNDNYPTILNLLIDDDVFTWLCNAPSWSL